MLPRTALTLLQVLAQLRDLCRELRVGACAADLAGEPLHLRYQVPASTCAPIQPIW